MGRFNMFNEDGVMIRDIEKARDKFLRAYPNFKVESLKGRNHVRRTVLISAAMEQLVSRYAGNNLSTTLSGGYMAGYSTIWPTEFIEIIAQNTGIPIELLVNNVNV
jgi:hypothetical protein